MPDLPAQLYVPVASVLGLVIANLAAAVVFLYKSGQSEQKERREYDQSVTTKGLITIELATKAIEGNTVALETYANAVSRLEAITQRVARTKA